MHLTWLPSLNIKAQCTCTKVPFMASVVVVPYMVIEAV